jgi:soluble lytic murein transglycosylase
LKKRRRRRSRRWQIVGLLLVLGIGLSFPRWITWIYPLPHQEIVFAVADEYEVDPYLVFAIIRAESNFETSARSPVGARGLMQIMPETAQWIARQMGAKDFRTEQLHDPEVNIRMGCWYLRHLGNEFKGNTCLQVAAYNAGDSMVSQWLGDGVWDGQVQDLGRIPYAETRAYVKNVLNNYSVYRKIYVHPGSP